MNRGKAAASSLQNISYKLIIDFLQRFLINPHYTLQTRVSDSLVFSLTQIETFALQT